MAYHIDYVGESGGLGVFQVFSFYQRFCFCGYVGVRIEEEIIVNTIHATVRWPEISPVIFKTMFRKYFSREKKIFLPVTDTVFSYEMFQEFHSDMLEAG
jgi:hypothetical protein